MWVTRGGILTGNGMATMLRRITTERPRAPRCAQILYPYVQNLVLYKT